MEEIVDDGCLRTALLDRVAVGVAHVDGNRANLPTALRAQQLEESPEGIFASLSSDPQNPLTIGIENHGGVALALMEGEFIDQKGPDP